MSAAFKNSGWLEGLNDTVMTDDIIDQFAQGYIQDMITDKDGNIVGVPGYTGYLAFWVNQEIMDEVGIKSIDTKEDFMKYMEAVSKDGRFGYGGSWEKTYAFNEIAQFVNMFGGDYFDWTKEENKEAIQFLHDLVANKETPVDQIADKYDQMNPKINDGKYGCWFMWGLGTDYAKADMLGADKIHMAMVPDFSGNGERAIFTDSWSYVLNSASKTKMQPLNSCSIWQMKVEWKHPIKHLTDILQERMLQKKLFRILILQKKYTASMQKSATYRDVRW